MANRETNVLVQNFLVSVLAADTMANSPFEICFRIRLDESVHRSNTSFVAFVWCLGSVLVVSANTNMPGSCCQKIQDFQLFEEQVI